MTVHSQRCMQVTMWMHGLHRHRSESPLSERSNNPQRHVNGSRTQLRHQVTCGCSGTQYDCIVHRQQQPTSQVTSQSPVLNTTEGSSVHIPHMAPCTQSQTSTVLWQISPEAEGQTDPIAGLLFWPGQLACPVKWAVMLLSHNSVLLRTPRMQSCVHCNQEH